MECNSRSGLKEFAGQWSKGIATAELLALFKGAATQVEPQRSLNCFAQADSRLPATFESIVRVVGSLENESP
jgi:hypothetical protein